MMLKAKEGCKIKLENGCINVYKNARTSVKTEIAEN